MALIEEQNLLNYDWKHWRHPTYLQYIYLSDERRFFLNGNIHRRNWFPKIVVTAEFKALWDML